MLRVAFILCFLVLFSETHAAVMAPRDTVERLHDHLLRVMRSADELGTEGRYAQLKPVLSKIFNFERMTQVVLGRQWKEMPADQQRIAVDAFADFSAATYASRFDGYNGERFETVGDEPGPRGMMLVSTRLVLVEADAVELTYLLAQTSDAWRITDVFFQGSISEMARLRSEFREILREGGSDLLIERLREQTRALLDPPV